MGKKGLNAAAAAAAIAIAIQYTLFDQCAKINKQTNK